MYSVRTSLKRRSPMISIRSRHSRRVLAIHLSAIAFARGARTGFLMIRRPTPAKTASNAAVNLASWSRIRNFSPSARPRGSSADSSPLSHPLPRQVRSNAGQVHPPAAMLNEEQYVQTAQEHRVDMEEVHGEDRLGLGLQKRMPGLPGPLRGGVDARVVEKLPHCRRTGRISQAGQVAMNAPVPQP